MDAANHVLQGWGAAWGQRYANGPMIWRTVKIPNPKPSAQKHWPLGLAYEPSACVMLCLRAKD